MTQRKKFQAVPTKVFSSNVITVKRDHSINLALHSKFMEKLIHSKKSDAIH